VTDRQLRLAILVLAVGQFALGLWMALSPGSFFDSFAGYGLRNDHYIRDVATLYLALGLVFAAASGRPSWRTPVLLFAVLQYAFHLVNHLVDIADSEPPWIGPVNVIALAGVEVVLVVLLRSSRVAKR
jgi:hypothetical protein